MASVITRRFTVGGRVQGVGFRPFVYRLAQRHSVSGWVRNRGGEVDVVVSGSADVVAAFRENLLGAAPPFARPRLLEETDAEVPAAGFCIKESETPAAMRVHVPPDQFCCDDCLRELRDPDDRRHRYPFVNCTQCGPRYTLIAALPYDRPNTAMAGFPLCPACEAEYREATDRRFHAEPVACPVCGPQLSYRAEGESATHEAALAAAVAALKAGAIVAVKGVGGYHLMCDAGNETTVQRLRRDKPRPHKPLAVLFPQRGDDGLAAVREHLAPTPPEASQLRAPERPIVLCPQLEDSTLASGIAPGLDSVGAMLPYSPLHHLLADDFDGPLVATSGNIGGDPVITEAAEAERRLAHVADAFLHHDRPILRPADDAVFRVIAGKARPLRLGRGFAPQEMELPLPLARPTLAVGGHMKNTIALGWGRRAVVSPHIGDLESRRGRLSFEQVIADLQRLYGVCAERVVADAHPAYASRRWAEATGLPLLTQFHHHAHAAALYAEHGGEGDWLVFTWDGVGFGEDGSAWGGELLLGAGARWRRVARLRPLRPPGGDRAGREPWRAAAALAWETGTEGLALPAEAGLARTAWQRGINAPSTSAVGRLFDAAAALLGLVQVASFEGQGPMWLEAIADPSAPPFDLPVAKREGLLELDWRPLVPMLLDGTRPEAERAGRFQAGLAAAVKALADRLAAEHPITAVGLTGGVFQNRKLTEAALARLTAAGHTVRLATTVPCNDGGLSYGQLAAVAYGDGEGTTTGGAAHIEKNR